jgi:hypothetical protein
MGPILAKPLFGDDDSPVTITGHSLRLSFRPAAFQEDIAPQAIASKKSASKKMASKNIAPKTIASTKLASLAAQRKKYHHVNPSRYIGRIWIVNLDNDVDYYEECEPGCRFLFTYNDGGTIGTLTVDHRGGRINLEWNGIAFQPGGPPFVIDTGGLQPGIVITKAGGQSYTLTIDNPANCQVVLYPKH